MKRQKYGGRQKGTTNKVTKDVRQKIKEVVDSELENIQDTLSKLSPKERTDLLTRLLPFILPKQNEHVIETNEAFNPIQIIITDDHNND